MIIRAVAALAALSGIAHAQTPSPTPAGRTPPLQRHYSSWAVFDHYRDANAALKADRARVIFFGDSITEAWALEPFITDNPHYVGRGVSGQTALQMLVRFRADVLALRPRVVHIMAGTNDVAENNGPERDEEIEGAIQSMTQLALAGHVRVVLASIPPAADFEWRPGLNPAPRIERINQWIESYAKRAGVGYVNYWSALATDGGGMKPGFSKDGVHPNAEGYQAMQPLARAAIERSLQR